jgi:hypothetical protein
VLVFPEGVRVRNIGERPLITKLNCKTTLETSEKDVNLHSKRVRKM